MLEESDSNEKELRNHLAECRRVTKSSFVGCTEVLRALGSGSTAHYCLLWETPGPARVWANPAPLWNTDERDRPKPLWGHERSWHKTLFLHSDMKTLSTFSLPRIHNKISHEFLSKLHNVVWLTFLICIMTARPKRIMTNTTVLVFFFFT